MKRYVFIFARTSDVGNIQISDLINLHFAGDSRVSSFEFETPTQCNDSIVALTGRDIASRSGYNPEEFISLILIA